MCYICIHTFTYTYMYVCRVNGLVGLRNMHTTKLIFVKYISCMCVCVYIYIYAEHAHAYSMHMEGNTSPTHVLFNACEQLRSFNALNHDCKYRSWFRWYHACMNCINAWFDMIPYMNQCVQSIIYSYVNTIMYTRIQISV